MGNIKHLLQVRNLCKYFAGLKAVDQVNFQLETGEILGLIGPNGSGKSTTINVITGLLPCTSGKIFVDHIDITSSKPYLFAKSGLARTFQTIRLFKELTVIENIEVAAVSTGKKRGEASQLACQLLEEIGLISDRDRLSSELSYGNQRKLEIARALAINPSFLLLDEPAAGLNEDESDQMLELLKEIPHNRQIGILIVDHDMRLIMRLCNRLHVLNYGKTIAEGSPEEIRNDSAVITAYLGSGKQKEGAKWN